MINKSIADLHPSMRIPVGNLLGEIMKAGLPFMLFEGYRSPERQEELYKQEPSVTNARAWESAHQFGLAIDIVGWKDGKWSWDQDLPWDQLHKLAKKCKLDVPMPLYDKPHIQSPAWQTIKTRL